MNKTFTDEEIKEILELVQHDKHTHYIGARYVPIFGRKNEKTMEWDNKAPYDPLTIVLHEGNSYTSRQYVPTGIDITNTDFWAQTGNYNAQIEQYREETNILNQITLKTFNTVADMKEYQFAKNDMFVKTIGYAKTNDCGGAIYHITDSGIVDNIFTIKIGDKYAHLIYTDTINIKQLGANSTIDCTKIIQTALNKCVNVYVPSGEYHITTISLNQNSHFFGDGKTSNLISSNAEALLIPKNADHAKVSNLHFHGGVTIGKTGTASVQDMNTELTNLYISGGSGLYIDHRGAYINNIHVADTINSPGIHIKGSDNFIENCITANTAEEGINVSGPNNTISNCKVFLADNAKKFKTGVFIGSSFNTVTNVVSQQNIASNFWIEGTGHVIKNCISDASFVYSKTPADEQYVAPYYETPTIDKSDIVLNVSIRNLNLEITNISRFFSDDQTEPRIKESVFFRDSTYFPKNSYITILINKNNVYANLPDSNISDFNMIGHGVLFLNGTQHIINRDA